MQRINFLHQAAILVASAAKSKLKRSSNSSTKKQQKQKQSTSAKSLETPADTRLMAMLSTQPGLPLPASGPAVIPGQIMSSRMPRCIATEQHADALKAKAKKVKKAANTLSVGKIHSRSTTLGKTQQERTLPAPDKSLSSVYVKDIRSIARKSVLRIDPNVKRTLCRNCNAVLIPGVTSSVRVKPSGAHVHRVRTTCLACGVHRTIPCPPLRGGNGWVDEGQAAEKGSQHGSGMLVEDTVAIHLVGVAHEAMSEDPPLIKGSGEAVDAEKPAEMTSHSVRSSKRPSKTKKNKRKRNLDDLVPGTRKQYTEPRFHDKKEHVLYKGYEKVQV